MKMNLAFAGVDIKNPIFVGSGPLTTTLEHLKKAEDCGVAGASLKHTYEKVPFDGRLRSYSYPGRGLYFGIDRRLNKDESLEVMRKAKEQTDLVLMVNLGGNSSDAEGWVSLAREFEQAGSDIIEINMVCPHIGVPAESLGKSVKREYVSGAQIGRDPELCFEIVSAMKKALRIAVVPKPDSTHHRFLDTVRAIENAGADGISVSATIPKCLPLPDIYHRGRPLVPLVEGASLGIVSGDPLAKHSAFGRVAQVRTASSLAIHATGGVSHWKDIIEMIMWGATAVGICTHFMWYGFEPASEMLARIEDYMEDQRIESLTEIRGISMKYLTTPDELRIVEGAAVVDMQLCNGCGLCTKPGHCNAIKIAGEKAIIEPKKCIGCSVCVSLCPRKAIHMIARESRT